MEVYLIVMNDCVVTKPMTDSIPMEKYYWSEVSPPLPPPLTTQSLRDL